MKIVKPRVNFSNSTTTNLKVGSHGVPSPKVPLMSTSPNIHGGKDPTFEL